MTGFYIALALIVLTILGYKCVHKNDENIPDDVEWQINPEDQSEWFDELVENEPEAEGDVTNIFAAPPKEYKFSATPGLFTQRAVRPDSSNIEYVKSTTGGWSWCILGSPTDKQCNVLANCVGYSCGRFNEIHREITGKKMAFPYLCCSARYFVDKAKEKYPQLTYSDIPAPGAIFVWEQTNGNSGHVAIVERVIDNETCLVSESGWKAAKPCKFITRSNENGRWGMRAGFKFLKFIVDPDVIEAIIPDPATRDENVRQVNVKEGANLRVRVFPSTDAFVLGMIPIGIHTFTDTEEADGHTWYKLNDQAWIAGTGSVEVLPTKAWVKPEEVERDTTKDQVLVENSYLRIRSTPTTKEDNIMGFCKKGGIYNVVEVEEKSDYTWYKLGDRSWIAGTNLVTFYPATNAVEEKPKKKTTKKKK